MSLEQLFPLRAQELVQLREADAPICADSTPVLFFGEIERARILTVGINPSWQEFSLASHEVLPTRARRFSHESDLVSVADPTERALADMRRYFQRSPYRKLLRSVEVLVRAFGASLYDGTAAHTDIGSCFASDPAWSRLNESTRARLSASGFETFREVAAAAPSLQRIIMIGSTAKNGLTDGARVRFVDLPTPLDSEVKFRRWNTSVLCEADFRITSTRSIPVLAIKPYLRGTPCAPLSDDEIASIPSFVNQASQR